LDRLAASTWLGLVDEDGAACGRVGTGVEIENDRAAGAQSVRDVATGVYVISGVCATVEIYLAEVTEDKILVYPELLLTPALVVSLMVRLTPKSGRGS